MKNLTRQNYCDFGKVVAMIKKGGTWFERLRLHCDNLYLIKK